jgi:single-strand DNA-binding protein
MNKVFLIGRLTDDPKSNVAGGATVCNFSLAVNSKRKDEQGKYLPIFYRVAVWRMLGERCMQYLHKGDQVGVTGDFDLRPYTDTNGNARVSPDVTADDVQFISTKRTSEPSAAPQKTPVTDSEDSLPF